MSYLPIIVNAGAFVMFMATPFARQFGFHNTKLMSASMLTFASYGSVASLASKFVSNSLSKNPYYEAICFFICFAGYYGAAGLLDMLVNPQNPRLNNTIYPKPNIIINQVVGEEEAAEKEDFGVDVLSQRIPLVIADIKEKLELAKTQSVYENSIFEQYMAELSKVLKKGEPKDPVEILSYRLKEIEDKYTQLTAKEAEIDKEKIKELWLELKGFTEDAAKYVLEGVEAVLESIPVEIDADKATLVECHQAIKKVIDKKQFRERLSKSYQEEVNQIRQQILQDEVFIQMLNMPGIEVMKLMIKDAYEQMMRETEEMREQVRICRLMVDGIDRLLNIWKTLQLIQSNYNGFIVGLEQAINSDGQPNFESLTESQVKYIREAARNAAQADKMYLKLQSQKLQSHLERAKQSFEQEQSGGFGRGFNNEGSNANFNQQSERIVLSDDDSLD